VTISLEELEMIGLEIRREVLEAAVSKGKGHIGPALSWVEIGVALFFGGLLNVRDVGFESPERDRFILSKGHGVLTLYALLDRLSIGSSGTPGDFGARAKTLPGHPDLDIAGVEANSGSLGHGLGIAAGMALAAKRKNAPWSTYVVLGDGECAEGSIWEAAMFSGHHCLSSLTAIVDRNGLGATEPTEGSNALEPLGAKFESFGWDVIEIDGHDLPALMSMSQRQSRDRPLAVIAHTVKGRGISYMEGAIEWHHGVPGPAEVREARIQLGVREDD
jgi:transketolase